MLRRCTQIIRARVLTNSSIATGTGRSALLVYEHLKRAALLSAALPCAAQRCSWCERSLSRHCSLMARPDQKRLRA